MFFARRVWLFLIVALVVAVLQVIEAVVVGWFTLEVFATGYAGAKLLAAALCFGVLTFVVIYVGWVQKYYYFYKLQRLLNEQMAGTQQHMRGLPDGTVYIVSGRRPYYTIEWRPCASEFTYFYVISDRYVWGESQASSPDQSMDGGPLFFDHRHTFKRLVKDLGAPVPA